MLVKRRCALGIALPTCDGLTNAHDACMKPGVSWCQNRDTGLSVELGRASRDGAAASCLCPTSRGPPIGFSEETALSQLEALII